MLTFSSSGSVSDHLVLHPQLATGNFIIKAVWLPGSQTELAIVTADFVKVQLLLLGVVVLELFCFKIQVAGYYYYYVLSSPRVWARAFWV